MDICENCPTIFRAIWFNHKECIIRQQHHISRKTYCGETVLTWCIDESIDFELVKWLIQYFNLDVNECDDKGCFPISLLLLDPSPSHLEFAEWLLTKGLDINRQSNMECIYPETSFCHFYQMLYGQHDEKSLTTFRIAARFFIFNGADLDSIRNGEFNKTEMANLIKPFTKQLRVLIK